MSRRFGPDDGEPVEGRELPSSRRIDPVTGEVVRARRRGRPERREPSSRPVEHLGYDWFPLRTYPAKERFAQLLLEDRGLVTFCPMVVRLRHRNRYDRATTQERTPIAYPWHPGLVFAGLTRPYRWHVITECAAVASIVSVTQGEIHRMDHAELYRLMVRFGRGRFIPPEHQRWMLTGAEFEPGDEVTMIDGPLADQPLKVEEIRGETARVFATFFGAERGFDAPVAKLRPRE